MYRYLVVWLNMNNDSYYFKILKHNYNNYYVGYVNQYNHKCIVMDDITSYISVYKYYPHSIKRIVCKKLISYLEKNI